MHQSHVIQCPKNSKTKQSRHGFPVETQRLRVHPTHHHQQYHQNSEITITNVDTIVAIAVDIDLIRRLH